MRYVADETKSDINKLPVIKVTICINGEDREGIWVAQDKEKGCAYLLNHAVAFYPFHSWGLKIADRPVVDIAEIRGDSPDTAVLTVHPEAYKGMLEHGVIDSEGNFIVPEEE